MFKHVSAELMFEWMHEFRLQTPGGLTRSADTYAVFANIKGYALTGHIQPYGLFGLGGVTTSSKVFSDVSATANDVQSAFAIRVGAGLDFYVTEHWFLNAEGAYVQPTGTYDDFAYGSVKWGLGYRF